MSNTRPCVIKVDKNKSVQATFHRFCEHAYVVEPSPMIGGAPGGQISIPVAIVEYEDGTVHYVEPSQITFTDRLKVVVSSDTEKVNAIRKALKENDGYCPCELQQTPDTKCMCKAFREQTTPGPCHCGLYEKQLKEDVNDGRAEENLG